MMLWDRLFWVWFIFSAAVVILVYLQEPNAFAIMFGLLLAGLGLGKLAEETGNHSLHKRLEKEKPKDVKLSRALLKKLEKQSK